MSLVSIVALVVGAIIGSGIFFTAPAVLRNSGSFVVSTIVHIMVLGCFVGCGWWTVLLCN